MLRPRVIPCLLLRNQGLVKSVKFKDYVYIGDPINTVRIFNEKEVDELIILDTTATLEKRNPSFELIKNIGSESFMPIAYGGGIRTLDEAREIISLGVEKIILNTAAIKTPLIVKKLSDAIGCQSVVVSIDIKKNWLRGYEVYLSSEKASARINPVEHAIKMQEMGAGELMINSVDRDGTFQGYDIELIRLISNAVTIPVIACGGAANLDHLKEALTEGGASAAAAGSLFVFHGRHKAVLISYPSNDQIMHLIN